MFEIDKLYVLNGIVFSTDSLEENKNLFKYVGIDLGDNSHTFEGVVTGQCQYVFECLLDDPGFASVVPSA